MRRLIAIAVVAMLAACGDNKVPNTPPPADDAPVVPPDDAPPVNVGGPCLDRPTDLARPTAALPCELLPPGFVPPRQKPGHK